MARADVIRYGALELQRLRAERQPSRAQHAKHGFDVRFVEVGGRHRDSLFHQASLHNTLAGTPTAVARAGMSLTTVAPAPTVAHSPTLRPGMTAAPMPMNAPRSILTSPARCVPGAM